MRILVLLTALVLAAALNLAFWYLPNRPMPLPNVWAGGPLQSASFAPYRRGQSPLEEKFPSQEEIEAYQRRNVTWHRPTWKLGDKAAGVNAGEGENVWVKDDLGLLGEVGLDMGLFGGKKAGTAPQAKDPKERAALDVLDLKFGVSLAEMKSKYKELAKRYHPDTHGGDKDAEERFKRINQAYTYLLTCGYT